MSLQNQLLSDAFDRHRERLFGDSSLKVYTTSPTGGEVEAGEFLKGWKAHRVVDTTTGFADRDTGSWQFQIILDDNWKETQAFMLKAVAFSIGDQRWRFKKGQKPVGLSPVFKTRAQMQ
ncbi:MAG TPA: hypothetical protein VGO43_13620 [Pyrinomonadaceae bacterium]|jgi:hypothetical protein|nr:hypothetical protein [Pyrinomonadaceae bacterium]